MRHFRRIQLKNLLADFVGPSPIVPNGKYANYLGKFEPELDGLYFMHARTGNHKFVVSHGAARSFALPYKANPMVRRPYDACRTGPVLASGFPRS